MLYSSPITGSSGPFAVTHFLQQADDETSLENNSAVVWFTPVKTSGKPKTYNPKKQRAILHSQRQQVPGWRYQNCPLIALPFDSLTFKVKDAVAFPITAKPSPNYTGANCVGSLKDVFAKTEHQQRPGL